MKLRSNMHPESRFDEIIPSGYSIQGLNFGNGPWVALISDEEIGRFTTMQGAQNFCWFNAGQKERVTAIDHTNN